MSNVLIEQMFERLENLRGRMNEAALEQIEKRLDEADRSATYHSQQAAEARSPEIRIASLEIIEKLRKELLQIAAEIEQLEGQVGSRIGAERNEP